MSVIAILVAVVIAFLAFRFITGMIKFGIIALIVIGLIYLFANGGLN